MILLTPNDPLPTTHSANGNVHRLVKISPKVLVLEPGSINWWAALVSFAFFLIVLAICNAKHADRGLTIGLSLFPVFTAAGFGIVAFCYHRFGTRVRFDGDKQEVSITGRRHGGGFHYPWKDIRAVQFCDAGRKQGEGAAWHTFQVNLVVGSDKSSRINLLDSAGKRKLHSIAKELADFIEVPLVA